MTVRATQTAAVPKLVRRRGGKTKALLAAEKRLDMALDAGASAENIAILRRRVTEAGGDPNSVVLKSELAEARSELDEMVSPIESRDTETPVQEADELAPFINYEPVHVQAVARGADARWVRGPNGGWFIAARWDQVVDGCVQPVRRDGTGEWVGIDAVMVSGQVSGQWAAVIKPLPRDFTA